jgi:hypothetical protein
VPPTGDGYIILVTILNYVSLFDLEISYCPATTLLSGSHTSTMEESVVVVLFIEHDAMNEGSEWCSGTWRYIISSSTGFTFPAV